MELETELKSIECKEIKSISGIPEPLAYLGPNEDIPVYKHPLIQFLQFREIYVKFTNGKILNIFSYYNDSDSASIYTKFLNHEEYQLTKRVPHKEICQSVTIKKVLVTINELNNLTEFSFQADGFHFVFISGEYIEERDGYKVVSPDETILFFDNPAKAKETKFNEFIPGELFEYD